MKMSTGLAIEFALEAIAEASTAAVENAEAWEPRRLLLQAANNLISAKRMIIERQIQDLEKMAVNQ